MSDEREAMAAAVQAVTAPQSLRVLHKVIIVDQDDNSVGVKLPSPGAPSETAKPVPVWFGLPGFAAVFNANAEASIGFHEGKEGGAFAALFPYYQDGTPSPIEYVSFLGGTKPIARVDDSTSGGLIRFTNTPPLPGPIPTGYLIEYVSPGGTVLLLGAVVGPVAVVPSPLTITLSGKITSGREEFRA